MDLCVSSYLYLYLYTYLIGLPVCLSVFLSVCLFLFLSNLILNSIPLSLCPTRTVTKIYHGSPLTDAANSALPQAFVSKGCPSNKSSELIPQPSKPQR